MRRAKTVGLSPLSETTRRAEWRIEATARARRGETTRNRGSYSDKCEFAEFL